MQQSRNTTPLATASLATDAASSATPTPAVDAAPSVTAPSAKGVTSLIMNTDNTIMLCHDAEPWNPVTGSGDVTSLDAASAKQLSVTSDKTESVNIPELVPDGDTPWHSAACGSAIRNLDVTSPTAPRA